MRWFTFHQAILDAARKTLPHQKCQSAESQGPVLRPPDEESAACGALKAVKRLMHNPFIELTQHEHDAL